MDEEFSYIEPNLIQVPSQAGALMRPKEMRSGLILMRLQRGCRGRKGGQAAHAEWPLNGLVERPVRASGQR